MAVPVNKEAEAATVQRVASLFGLDDVKKDDKVRRPRPRIDALLGFILLCKDCDNYYINIM